jgi:hypothetical protein
MTNPAHLAPASSSAAQLADALDGRASGGSWMASCPAHDDEKPSLSISEGRDGKVLVKCHAGCSQQAVIDALKARGVWGKGGLDIHQNTCATVQPGCTLAQYAEAKGLPVGFLRDQGLSDVHYMSKPAVRIPYRDCDGNEIAVRFRCALDGADRFRWRKGSKPRLYGLWRPHALDHVILCEGESDAHTLWQHGFPALGLPGAANWKEPRDAADLDAFETIYVIVESDKGGEAVQRWLATSRIRDRVRLVDLGKYKDPSGIYLADRGQFKARFQAALERATPWADHVNEQMRQTSQQAWRECRDLASDPAILDRFASELEKNGVVGESRAAKLVYLALTTRFFSRPVSLVVKGASSSGKSHLTERVLAFSRKTFTTRCRRCRSGRWLTPRNR